MTKGLNVYKIEKSDLGFDLTFGGDMTKAELEKWYKESDRVLTGRHGPFGVIIDMRTLAPLSRRPSSDGPGAVDVSKPWYATLVRHPARCHHHHPVYATGQTVRDFKVRTLYRCFGTQRVATRSKGLDQALRRSRAVRDWVENRHVNS